MKLIPANTLTATFRRVYFDLRQSDGLTPATAEASGQPQISIDAGSWTNTGIGVLQVIGNGRYAADLTQATVATPGTHIETRYKSGNTIESPGQSALVVGFNPFDAVHLGLSALPNAAAQTSGGLPTVGTGASQLSVDGSGNVNANVAKWNGGTPNGLLAGRVDANVGAYQAGLAPLQPTVAGRTLKVSDIGTAAPDWANIGSPTTTVNLSGTTISAVSGAVGAVTGNVGGSVTGSVGGVVGNVSGDLTGNVQGSILGSLNSLASQAKQDVLTSAQNALGSTTWTQPGQASPPANNTMVGMQAYVYKSFRNKITQSSTTFQLFNDDNATVDQRASVLDDGTTFTRGKLTSGP